MSTVHLMIGIPGSGKTTYVNKLLKTKKGKEYILISTDLVRKENPNLNEKDLWPLVYKKASEYLKDGKDIIFDATNITPKVRQRLVTNLKQYIDDFQVKAYYFPTDYKICIDRVVKRNKIDGELFLPPEVCKSYGENVIPPQYDEKFKSLKLVHINDSLLKGLVVDPYQGYAFYYRNKDEVIEEYNGFESVNTKKPIRSNSCFRLASVSKQFIAYGIMKLVENKLLSYKTTLYSLFNDMPEYTKKITISHMLYHTSGLYDYENMPHTDEQISDYDVLDYIRETNDTYFKPGEKYQYSNTAYVILGLVLEKTTLARTDFVLEDLIFKPLKMLNTKANYEGETKFENRAYGHIKKRGKFVQKDQYWCSATIGDGGIYSNIDDLKKWLYYLHTTDYKTLNKTMFKPNIIGDVNTEYGYGIRNRVIKGYNVVYHCGSTIGTRTIIGFIKELDVEFIFLTNIDGIETSILIDNIINDINKKAIRK